MIWCTDCPSKENILSDTSSFNKSQFLISNTLILGGAIKRVADILDPLDE